MASTKLVTIDGMLFPEAFISDTEKTFQYQDSLPSLPVHPLPHILDRYLDSVKPLLTDQEFNNTQAIVKKFGDGIGKELHQKLVQKAKENRNWLFQWWEDIAYLQTRTPHTPYVNFGGPGPYMHTFWPPEEGTQIRRAATILWFTLKYWELLKKQKLRVDRGGKTTIWCMHQFHRTYNSCKTPHLGQDRLNDYFKTDEEGHCPSHIVVLCKGRFFHFDVCDGDGNILTPPELQVQLQRVRDVCEHGPPAPGLGVMTAENRDVWAKISKHTGELHPDNQRHLETIYKSATVLVLDEASPPTEIEVLRESMIGEGTNRWFDKTLQFIVFKNGTIGCNGDHCPQEAMTMVHVSWFNLAAINATRGEWRHFPIDGMVFVMLLLFQTECLNKNKGSYWRGSMEVRQQTAPVEMVFHLDDTILRAIDTAKDVFRRNGDSVEMTCGHFTDYGRDYFRQYKLHPDTFVQMAIQYTYYRMYRKPAPTYETATVRKFYKGRTETVRTCTPEVVSWTKSMLDNTGSKQEKVKLLISAINKHNKLMAEAMECAGCDRVLLGLQLLAMEQGMPLPEIYTDPAYTKSGGGGNFVISTSFVGYTPVFGGVAPMCKDGYGCFYSLIGHKMHFFISAWAADTSTSVFRFYDEMVRSLREMKELLDATQGGSAASEAKL